MSALPRLLSFLRPYARRVAIAALCSLVVAAATSAYAYLAGPVLKLLMLGEQGLPSVGVAHAWTRRELLAALPVALVAVAVVRGAALFGYAALAQVAGQRAVADLRRTLFGRLLDLSLSFHDRSHSGDLLSRFVADVQAVEATVTFALTSYIRDGVQVAALLITCALLDLRLLVVGLIAAPLAVIVIGRFGKALQGVTRQAQESLGRLTQRASEAATHVRILQAYRAEAQHLGRVDEEIGRYLALMRRSFLLRAAFTPALEMMAVVGLAAALYVATRQIDLGKLTADHFLSFVAALLFMYQPVKALVGTSQVSLQGMAAAARVFDIIDARSDVVEAPSPRELPPFSREIAFDRVSLSYQDVRALDSVSLTIRSGEAVALVGPSGGGKSSIASLLFRFYDPQAGCVLIDGADVRGVTLASLRRQLALVTQEPFLFAGTIRDNIACAKPGATEAEVVAAARAANAWEFIERTPSGLDAPVGERGALLSGGQRQRIAIARAFLKAAPVLVLDEATSSLDPASEAEVQKGLAALVKDRTVLVIAHRLETVRNADRILVVDRGRIVEEGDHDSLRASGGLYARLWAQGAA
jgi:ATP-binding cassette, subfamily B, bacterial MsbA